MLSRWSVLTVVLVAAALPPLACGFDGSAARVEDAGVSRDTGATLDATTADAATRPVEDASATVDVVDAPSDTGDDGVTPPTTAVGATKVAGDSLDVDLVKFADGPIVSDGLKDGLFEVEVTGPATALALIRTNAAGTPEGYQQWDTWVGPDVIPASLGGGFPIGASTFQVGVYEGAVLQNDASGRLTLPGGPHTLRLAAANVGSFVTGSFFRVVLLAPDGTLARGPVVAY